MLKAFGSFGFCKAHAAAFALPTYQSAWLKAHHPAAFLAGVLTHDPGMYPKRLILDDARQFGIAVLGARRQPLRRRLPRGAGRRARRAAARGARPGRQPRRRTGPGAGPAPQDDPADPDGWRTDGPGVLGGVSGPRSAPSDPRLPDGRGYGIRIGLADVKGISEAEIARIVAGRPYASLSDFWHRAAVSRPVVERLVVAGAFDSLYGLGSTVPVRRRGQVTRRDLLLQVAELDRWSRSTAAAARRAARAAARPRPGGDPAAGALTGAAGHRWRAVRRSSCSTTCGRGRPGSRRPPRCRSRSTCSSRSTSATRRRRRSRAGCRR